MIRLPCQYVTIRPFATTLRSKPFKQTLFIQLRNIRRKSSPVPSTEPVQAGNTSHILQALGFTLFVGTASSAALFYLPDRKKPRQRESFSLRELMVGIIGVNAVVFAMWKIPRLTPFMYKYFTCSASNPKVSMLLSAFSHQDFFHFAMNMYVFWSFCPPWQAMGNKESFAWLYINGATVSALASIVYKVMRGSAVPSVGASGAVLACIACVCYAYPDARLGIPFISDITKFTFTADTGLKAILIFDICGLLLRAKLFDHAAHLGGVLFGLWYMHYGRHIIHKLRIEQKKFRKSLEKK